MAEPEPTRPPSLPATADAVPYAPVSWLAVAAVAAAGLFVLLLVLFGIDAFRNKKPLLMPEVLLLPVVAIVLSFAARRVIRNSEGTRVGEDLANVAWWTALVLLLGYTAYLGAIDFSIRREAQAEAARWVGLVLDDRVTRAFDRTLPPAGRFGDDEARMRAQNREPLHTFELSDLARVARRNPGACAYAPGGLRDWAYRPWGVEAVAAGTLTCPEGSFPVAVPMKATDAAAGAATGRQWQITNQPGYFQADRVARTRYGWLVEVLERQGGAAARQFVQDAVNPQAGPLAAYTFHAGVTDLAAGFPLMTTAGRAALARVVGGVGFLAPLPAEYYRTTADRLFTLPGGAAPTEDQRRILRTVWQNTRPGSAGLLPAGSRLRNPGENTVTPDLITLTDGAVEVRAPAELALPGEGTETARARVVVACADPAVLAELRQLREAAARETPTERPPDDLLERARTRPFPWRLARIETDLVRVRLGGRGPDAGGGAGGGGGLFGGTD